MLQETDARGRFAEILKGVVAVDDVMAILLFSVLLAAAGWITGEGLAIGFLRDALREVGGAVALGLALGLPAAALTGRLQPGRASLEEALGLVLVCVGLAMWLEVSSILAAIVMGGTIANLASHHERPFHEIENIEWPFLVVFFLLAGASLDVGTLGAAGPATIGYVLFRAAGKLIGPPIGGRILGSDREDVRWLGLALMPQAGVALGLALAAVMRFPSMASDLLNVVVTGTVVFELGGPVLTRLALRRSGALSDQ